MRKQILVGAMALALAAGTSSSAMAFGRGGIHGGGWGGVHAGMARVHGGAFAGPRFAGVRGYSSWRHGGWGGRRLVGGGWGGGWGYGYPYDAYAADVGLVGLGLGLATVATGYCDPYYGCGPGYGYYGYGTPIDAWSW